MFNTFQNRRRSPLTWAASSLTKSPRYLCSTSCRRTKRHLSCHPNRCHSSASLLNKSSWPKTSTCLAKPALSSPSQCLRCSNRVKSRSRPGELREHLVTCQSHLLTLQPIKNSNKSFKNKLRCFCHRTSQEKTNHRICLTKREAQCPAV